MRNQQQEQQNETSACFASWSSWQLVSECETYKLTNCWDCPIRTELPFTGSVCFVCSNLETSRIFTNRQPAEFFLEPRNISLRILFSGVRQIWPTFLDLVVSTPIALFHTYCSITVLQYYTPIAKLFACVAAFWLANSPFLFLSFLPLSHHPDSSCSLLFSSPPDLRSHNLTAQTQQTSSFRYFAAQRITFQLSPLL
jgi:hypothetical protein